MPLQKLKVKRAYHKGTITKIENYILEIVKSETNFDMIKEDLEIRTKRLENAFQQYENIQLEILNLDPNDVEDIFEIENKFMEISSEIRRILKNNETAAVDNLSQTIGVPSTSTSLPSIEIPYFSGKDIGQFKPFIDLFRAVIDDNQNLSEVQKLFYLKKYLSGEALSIINNLPLVNESYEEALNLLNKRYDNPVILINNHLNCLLDMVPLQKGTASNLREFVSIVLQEIGSLKNLKQPINQWDTILICILTKKLDSYTNRAYQVSRDSKNLPTLVDFIEFLESRATALEASTSQSPKVNKSRASINFMNISKNNEQSIKNHNSNMIKTQNSKNFQCTYCTSSDHKIHYCQDFKLISASDRFEFVNSRGICKMCLNKHSSKCKYPIICNRCNKNHNTLLHLEKEVNKNSLILCEQESASTNVLLPSAKVRVLSNKGEYISVKVLLDSGSQLSLIKQELVNNIKCEIYKSNLNLIGVNERESYVDQMASFRIFSSINQYEINVTCAVVDKITSKLPQFSFNTKKLNIPKGIELADPNYNIPDEISILLGADIFFSILLTDSIKLGPQKPTLQNTLFGYIVSGVLSSELIKTDTNTVYSHHCALDTKKLDSLMERFWQAESIPEGQEEFTNEQEACENSFREGLTKIHNKFQVKLPLKLKISDICLGDSYSFALKRFLNLEKRFQHDKTLFRNYSHFIHEYLELDQAEIIDSDKVLKYDAYFLAHHPVIRNDKKTTKLRVVFDGGMKTNYKVSLNDFLFNGKIVQKDIYDILLLFRMYEYILITDIRHMFRSILVHPEHRSFQVIIWRDDPSLPLTFIQLKTVTYGLKSSPFLATRCLSELASTYKDTYPLASKILLNNTYIDDIIYGSDCIEEIMLAKGELIELLNLGDFKLHKWASNHAHIISDIPVEFRHFNEIELNKNPEDQITLKALGLVYDIKIDKLKINFLRIEHDKNLTKRIFLSIISRLYDPLGLIGPIVIVSKLLMQKLWVEKIGWDTQLPSEIHKNCQQFLKELSIMPTVILPRNINNLSHSKRIELLGFCDASMSAYGCCIYVKIIDEEGNISINLLTSKSRVAPLNKKLTIPKLELNGAVLLSKLMSRVSKIFETNIEISRKVLFSDSEIVLSWIRSIPLRLNVYVANRITLIRNLTSDSAWHYVSSENNPADLLTKNVRSFHSINQNKLWWHGPENISEYQRDDNFFSVLDSEEHSCIEAEILNQEVPSSVVLAAAQRDKLINFEDYSSISRIQRILAFALRFIKNCKLSLEERVIGNLTCEELNNGLNAIVVSVQFTHFQDEIQGLRGNGALSSKSSLQSLYPFIDQIGLLRVGGRLHNAPIPYSEKHPIILPKNCHITNLLIIREHINLFHAGTRLVLSNLNKKFWLVNGVREIKKVLHKCVRCFKLKAKCSEQLMGSFPAPRVSVSRPFEVVGIDFCGPFNIKQSRLRKVLVSKGYISVFVCFSTKAIHLELVSDLKTETFIAAFKRFSSRRNLPSQIYCDNGATFKGAQRKFDEFFKLYSTKCHKDKIEDYAASVGIKFNFIPSYSPVFGGLWEAGVKSVKFHLKRVVGDLILTYEEFNTFIVQIEGILNSRPLSQTSQDPSDLNFITPAHFLTGAAFRTLPEADLSHVPQTNLKFWKLCTKMRQDFWNHWHRHYLLQLQNRPKWKKSLPNIEKGMLVLVKEDNLPPLNWPIGRILRVIPGRDNKVRVVEVYMKNKSYLRSITKIAVLPIYD